MVLPFSVSSSYKELMPQFLRAIRMLCALYKHYVEATKKFPQQVLASASMPTSPALLTDSLHPGSANVRRAESFGSILDSPDVRHTRRQKSGHRFGHTRSHSGGTAGSNSNDSSRDLRSNTIAAMSSSSPGTRSSLQDPFEPLETVWLSFQSWFDLLKVELDRVEKVEESRNGVGEPEAQGTSPDLLIAKCKDTPETSNLRPSLTKESKSTPDTSDTNIADLTSAGSKKKYPSSLPPRAENSILAAAIVSSTPSHLRAAFLHPSSTVDMTPSFTVNERAQKRSSWHVERVTARFLSSLSPGSSLIHLPAFNRSNSSDPAHCESPLPTSQYCTSFVNSQIFLTSVGSLVWFLL